MTRSRDAAGRALGLASVLLAGAACHRAPTPPPGAFQMVEMAHPDLPIRAPRAPAAASFRHAWYDGNAELSGYGGFVPRYGELRPAELALVYVTEPMSRATWVKDDDAPADLRVDVMKLNANLTFQTGIYPYSVMTSVFSPIDDWGGERFDPAKLTLTAQEWCGHVFHGLWTAGDHLDSRRFSYFADEAERHAWSRTPPQTLYEDALLIQLRELDGAFAGGGDWAGSLVPSLWRLRRDHVDAAPHPATIRRTTATVGGAAVTRFELRSGGYTRTIDVEAVEPRRILGWTASDGERVALLGTVRLPYWELNANVHGQHRSRLGLAAPPPGPAPVAHPGTTRIGR